MDEQTRTVLTDGTRRWFNRAAAEHLTEAKRRRDGKDVSIATGDYMLHEALYRTVGGRWILRTWSDYTGDPDAFVEVDDVFATGWLVKNDHADHPSVVETIAALEIV